MDEDNKQLSLEELLSKGDISKATYDKTRIAKTLIENKYNLKNTKAAELNAVLHKIDTLNMPKEQREIIKKRMIDLMRQSKHKQTIHDYESLSVIGRGAFGEVHVCRNKSTKEIVAIKKIKKTNVVEKNQLINAKNEQAFLSKVKSNWIVELKASFQEGDHLYLVMEYLPGGDLMNLFILKDTLNEKEAQFYFAELILCIESIHKLDCIHRDIKPDNILLDKNGHIKLSDFGLAKIADGISGIASVKTETDTPKHRKNFSCVGTAYYVAPEVLEKKGYGQDIDWWSAGAILYEMLIGYAPFYSENTADTCYKILNWKYYLKFPHKKAISPLAKDLICKLLCNREERLGKNGVQEIKSHPFLKGVEWSCISKQKPPFVPQLKNDHDTSYFEKYDIEEPFYPVNTTNSQRNNFYFSGYTYKKNDEKVSLVEELNDIIEKAKSEKKEKAQAQFNEKKYTINANDDLDFIFGNKSPTNKAAFAIIPLPQRIQIDCSKKLVFSSEKSLISNHITPKRAMTNTKASIGFKPSYNNTTITTEFSPSGKIIPCNDLIDVAKEQLSQIHQKIRKKTHKSPVPRMGKLFLLNNNNTIIRKFTTISADKRVNKIK